jgi:transcriptional regulator with XRE-family HTH domain
MAVSRAVPRARWPHLLSHQASRRCARPSRAGTPSLLEMASLELTAMIARGRSTWSEGTMTQDHRIDRELPPGPAKDLVDLFRRLQPRNRLTVGQLAMKTAMSPSHISEVLRGRKTPSPPAAERIAQALGAGPDDMRRAWRLAEDLAELNRYNRKRWAASTASIVSTDSACSARPDNGVLWSGSGQRANSQFLTRMRRHRPANRLITVFSACALAVTSAFIGTSSSWFGGDGSSLVSGSATCVSGRPVVGIWIAASSGQKDSGFAHLGPATARTDFAVGSTVTYSYLLPHGGTYSAHVGCGGTASDWDSRNFSPLIIGRVARVRCDDPAATRSRRSTPAGTCT